MPPPERSDGSDTVRDARVARTRADVSRAALQVLTTEGADALTHAHVADIAGYSKTTLYTHWPSRVELIALALDAAAGHLDGTTTAAAAIDRVLETIDRDGLDTLSAHRGHPGDMARPRRAEILAALSRCRSLAERSS